MSNEEQNNLKPPDPLHELEKKEQEPNSTQKQTEQKINKIIKYIQQKKNEIRLGWSKIETGDKAQIVLVFINIIMVGAFIYFSGKQIEKTNEALDRADTTIELTKRSILSSDSTTREALRISDSSLAISQYALEINKTAMVTTNTPYFQIKAQVIRFNPDTIEFKMTFKNVGNTPALLLLINIGYSFTPPNKLPIVHEPIKMIGNLVSPHDSVTSDVTHLFNKVIEQQLYVNVILGIFTFKLAGILVYNDVFGHRYRVQFYYVWDPDKNVFTSPSIDNDYKRIK